MASKATISKALRMRIWYERHGKKIGAVCCPICNDQIITQMDFSAGHIEPETPTNTVFENLIPICAKCNSSCGRKDLRLFTRSTFGRDLVLPIVAGESNIVLPIDHGLIDFCEKEFMFGSTFEINRKELMRVIESCILGTKFKYGDVFHYFKTKYEIDIMSVPSHHISGVMLRSEYEKGRKEAEIIHKFFEECFTHDSAAVPILARQVRVIWSDWKRCTSSAADVTVSRVLESMKLLCGGGSTDNEFYNIRMLF
jgi:hypothetical protein